MKRPLNPHERWMVRSNLATIASGTQSTTEIFGILHANGYPHIAAAVVRERLEYLRTELRAARLSWGEVHELQTLAAHIPPGDVELLEAAAAPEHSV